MRRDLCIALLGLVVIGTMPGPARAQVDWSTEWLVQYRSDPSMAFDTGRNRLVVFGGTSSG